MLYNREKRDHLGTICLKQNMLKGLFSVGCISFFLSLLFQSNFFRVSLAFSALAYPNPLILVLSGSEIKKINTIKNIKIFKQLNIFALLAEKEFLPKNISFKKSKITTVDAIGLNPLFKNIISGMVFDGTRITGVIECNGVKGEIKRVGLLHTWILDDNGKLVMLNNDILSEKPVTLHSCKF